MKSFFLPSVPPTRNISILPTCKVVNGIHEIGLHRRGDKPVRLFQWGVRKGLSNWTWPHNDHEFRGCPFDHV